MNKRRSTKLTAPAMPNVFAAYDAMSAACVLDCRETSALKPQSVTLEEAKNRAAYMEERRVVVDELIEKVRRLRPLGDPGVLDVPHRDSLISLGYTQKDANLLALRPTPRQLSPDLEGKLASIKVLWRQPYLLTLWGIPYMMREGQNPGHLWSARENWVAPKPGHHGSKRVSLADWVYLGQPGWWGSKSRADIDAIKAWLDLPHVKPCIPGNDGEWSPLDEPGKEGA